MDVLLISSSSGKGGEWLMDAQKAASVGFKEEEDADDRELLEEIRRFASEMDLL
jgi:uncharacterized protein YgfB (UPF0149 family)